MKIVFWVSLGTILYVYVSYPFLLAVFSLFRSRPTTCDDAYVPTVSLIITAYNEEKFLAEKLENSLSLNYPKSHLEIVVASDGSTDGTNDIAKSYETQGVTLHVLNVRRGKTRALNHVIPKTHGEILILSDANAMYQEDAIQKLTRHFVDSTVGAVSGDVRLVNVESSFANAETLYYQYERFIQKMESRLGSMIGADGAMYAVSRKAFSPPSDTTIVDDFVISMTVARHGHRVLYEEEAVAFEGGALSEQEEFRRKVRIVAGGIHSLMRGEGLPKFNQSFLWFCYLSHKLLRWLMPFFLFSTFLASVALADEPLYQAVLVLQILVYGAALTYLAGMLPTRIFKWNCVPYYFCLMNGAALIGFWKGLSGGQSVVWQPTRR